MSETYNPYSSEISQAENQYGVPSGLLYSVLGQESSFDPTAYNASSGSYGLAQVLPSTAADPGYGIAPFDPSNPQASISFGAQYLAALKQKYGSWTQAVHNYGTVPSSGNLTQGQQNVLNVAMTADKSQGNNIPNESWFQWLMNGFDPVALGESAAGKVEGTVTKTVSSFMLRVIVAGLGLMFITMGLGVIAFSDVTKHAKKIVTTAASVVGE